MSRHARGLIVLVLALTLVAATLASAAPEGQLTTAVHFTLAPTLFEPAETPGLVTPFMFLYALHDALVKPMPDRSMAPRPGGVVERHRRMGSSMSSCCARE